jgi:hypothetical protein
MGEAIEGAAITNNISSPEVRGKTAVWEYLNSSTGGGVEKIRTAVLDGSFPGLFYDAEMARRTFAADIHLVSPDPQISVLTRDELSNLQGMRRAIFWNAARNQPVLLGENKQKYNLSGVAQPEQVASGVYPVEPTWMVTEEARQAVKSSPRALSQYQTALSGPAVYHLGMDLYCKPERKSGNDYTRLTMEFGKMWRLYHGGIDNTLNFDAGGGRVMLEGNSRKGAKLRLRLGHKTGKDVPWMYIKIPRGESKPVEIGLEGKWKWKLRGISGDELINELKEAYTQDGKETLPSLFEALNFSLGNN